MTVPVQTIVNSYISAGTSTFIYSFQALSSGHIVVTVNGITKTLGTDYAVTGVGVQAGGTITGLATVAGDAVVIRRVVPLERLTDYQNNGDLLARTLNPDFDSIWQALQQIQQYGAKSALRGQDGETLTALAAAATRAGKMPVFNSSTGDVELSTFTATQVASAVAAAYGTGSTADAITFLPAGSGAVGQTVQTKLRETVNVATASALRALPPPGIDTFATVKGGAVAGDGFGGEYFWDNTATNPDNGDTVLIPNAGGTGRWKKTRMADPEGWYNRACASPNSFAQTLTSSKRWPRDVVFIGDSITFGYPTGVATHQQSPLGVLQTMLSQQTGWEQGNWPCGGIWQRWTLAGGITYGTKGPAAVSLIMAVGATATISGDYLDQIIIFFRRQVAGGNIEVRVNGTLVTTINTSGVAADDIYSNLNLGTRYGAGATVVLTCTTAAVEIIAVDISRSVAGNVPRIVSHAYPGFSTYQYINAGQLASIITCNAYSVQTPLYVIALGTNDAYQHSVGYQSTSVQYEANLRTIVAALGIASCVLCVPLRPNPAGGSTLWSGTETFENYRNAVYRVAKDSRIPVIDQSKLDFTSSGFYQADGVHPTVQGYAALAAFWYEKLGFGTLFTDRIFTRQDLTLTGGATAAGAPYSTPQFTVERDGVVRLHGNININGLAALTNIATLTDGTAFSYPYSARPLTQKNLLACGVNGVAGTSVQLLVSPSGVITLLAFSAATNNVCLDGLSFSTLY